MAGPLVTPVHISNQRQSSSCSTNLVCAEDYLAVPHEQNCHTEALLSSMCDINKR